MEQKSILISALSVGVGVGVGIGLASGQSVGKWGANILPSNAITAEKMEQEMLRQIVDGRESNMLAKALAHYFEAKLLLLDLTDFSLKIQSKYGSSNKESSFKRSTSESTLERLSDLFGSFSIFSQREEPKGKMHRPSCGVDLQSMGAEASCNPPTLRRNASSSSNISGLALQTNPTNSDFGISALSKLNEALDHIPPQRH
ncbi:AAA domain-containing protein isoform X3 [Spatholobus suberectus]|nr:AAA domain-containing protein isoform X3 [Spatholobus suberectus]